MRLPDDSKRLTIYGMTGSGKTWAALWHLSMRSYDTRPWVIFDFKGDENIARIPYLEEIDIKSDPRKLKRGLFVTRPLPDTDDENVEDFMKKMWERERIGSYVDEGYMIARNNRAFKWLLTQGRSKSIPMINLTQRPVDVTRFMISEADFHHVYRLSDERDTDTVQRFIPFELERTVPDYHSFYYDVGANDFTGLKPVPHVDESLGLIETRLKRTLRVL